jgi:hypothetical protein
MKIAGKPEGEPTGRNTTASEGSVLDHTNGEPQVSTDDFRPIKIIGERLSETIIRERR